jgi:hypothetical protein
VASVSGVYPPLAGAFALAVASRFVAHRVLDGYNPGSPEVARSPITSRGLRNHPTREARNNNALINSQLTIPHAQRENAG